MSVLRTPARLLAAAAALLAPLASSAPPSRPAPAVPSSVLARVPVDARLSDVGAPVYAHLRGADGVEYALVLAAPDALAGTPAARPLVSGARPEELVVALERRTGARERARRIVDVLLDDGRHVVARATEAQAAALSAAGFDLVRLPAEPMAVAPAAPAAHYRAVAYDASVAEMVAGVTEADVAGLVGELAGATPVLVEGAPVTLLTRHTLSGAMIRAATQYSFERFAALGLSPSFHAWASGRNVVADLPGAVRPDEVVVVCAHLDDMPGGELAPGADDDASGSAAVLLAARALSAGRFERTVRFVLFTGEEQGLYGSTAYAGHLASLGTNVVAVLNLDMIGWDGAGGPVVRLHTRTSRNAGYAADLAIARTFRDAVAAYLGDALLPVDDPDGITASDHYPFWQRGWPAILAIEDDVDDFNPNYHTTADTLANLDLPYVTSFTRAAVATAAHLAVPAPSGTRFYPVTPCRLLDTRDAGRPEGLGPPALAARQTRAFAAAPECGLPADAAALSVNVTVTEATAEGWVTLFPGAGAAPGTSNVHFRPGRTRAAASIVPVGAGAAFSAHNASDGSLHLVVDVNGWFR